MTSLLLATLPSLGFRPAGGLSRRLGCHVLGHRGTNAAPRVTRQQVRFVSNDIDPDYKDPWHYETLGVKTCASIEVIKKAWAAKNFALHSDINGNKSKEEIEHYHGASTAGQERAADMLRVAKLARQATRLREQREEAKRAKAAEEAAGAKKRDEERQAKKLADRAARTAEVKKQRQAEAERPTAEEIRKETERRAAVNAAKAAKKNKPEGREAREAAQAADRRKAAAQAREAEREMEARVVVLRHVPIQAGPFDFTEALRGFKAGRILNCGVISQEFLGERANMNEPVNELVKRKLRERRFAIPPVGIFSGFTPTGMWLVQEYSSVALAQSPRAVMEKYFAKDLEVEYTEDSGGGVHQIAQGDAGAGSGSSRKESKSSHWLAHLQWMLLS
ncbi:hypothetical protein F5883DRAFT_708582 [Diaporthe sp. PMI_573]|nr:hypothetical protein F5883DRAFT_708582 [Diaporthaceae sp. PMI_573]